MQVNNISLYQYKKEPSFEGHNLHVRQCSKILNNISEFTPQGYERMSLLSKIFLRMCTPARMQELAKTTCDTAFKVKSKFDKKFGENNYLIMALGRSIASVAEVINFMGAEAVILPLSGLRHSLPRRINDIDLYRDYLQKIGITKDRIKNETNKKFILMDYAVSGDSLMTAKEFLEKPELLGKSENFLDYEINPIVKSLKILKLFYYERFKNYAPVGRLDINNLKDVNIQSDSATSREGRGDMCQFVRKLFLFNLLDSLKKDEFHDFKPKKELDYIERFESEEYLEKLLGQSIDNFREEVINLTKKISLLYLICFLQMGM